MSSTQKRPSFYETPEAIEAEKLLIEMSKDSAYNTGTSYSADGEMYPDHQRPFVDKHMEYLRSHPAMSPQHYLANLRLMTRIRQR
jgi:hypothetical protein